MNKTQIVLMTIVCLALGAPVTARSLKCPQVIEYKDTQQFGVVVVQENGLDADQTRDYAHRRAAQLTIDNGYRYFVIEQERTVKIAKTRSPNQFPVNLYQQVVIEEGRGPTNDTFSMKIKNGYQVLFQCFEEASHPGAIDAAAYLKIHCNE